jgi:phage tail sheath gpL-like
VTITFNEIPTNLRIPFVAAEFDSSLAAQGPALLAYRTLIIGQKTSAGSAAANSLHKVTSPEDVIALAGRGSLLHRQAIAYFKSNRITETWIGVLADDGAGVDAEGTITVTGPATADGTIALWMGGQLVTVAVASGDTADDIAALIEAAIDADLDLPVTAAVAGAVVTVTFRHVGLSGNSYNMRHSYADGEELPAGVGLAFVQLATGTTSPALATLLAALGDQWFQVIIHPYTDATSLTALESEMADRFGPMEMIDGVLVTAASGSFSTLSTLGNTRNSKHSIIFAQPGETPITPPWEFAAEAGAILARYAAIDPARPFQTLPFAHSLPPAEVDLFTKEERNLLLYEGIATSKVEVGVVQMERAITTYQLNPAGAADPSYLDATTLFTLLYLRYSFRIRLMTRYPRHKLADDGTRFGAGQAVMTPKLGRAEALAWFDQMEELGLVENVEQFKADLVCERNAVDRNRLDYLLPPDLINSLIVQAVKFAFRL